VTLAEASTIPAEAPVGTVVAVRDPDLGGYTIAEDEAGYVVRFYGAYDVRISRDLRSIRIHVAPDVDRGLVPVILAGTILAALLELRGSCMLHASCVEVGGATFAVVGASGMGKSTLAALFCAAGGRIVADDALRIEHVRGVARCYPGSGQIRVRKGAAELAGGFPSAAVVETGDGRIGINAERVDGSSRRLDALLIPNPSRDTDSLTVERLGQREALIALVSYPRVVGWQHSDPARRHFEVLSGVAATVPAFNATILWGHPFEADVASRLLRRMGLSPAGLRRAS
jgi:hypothetical protein